MAQTARTAPPPSNRKPSATRPSTPARISLPNLIDEHGAVKMEALAAAFSMSRAQLAETAGLARAVLQKSSRRDGPKAQGRVREMLEIIHLIQTWAGSAPQAMAWYRAEPIPAFGGRTAEALVKSGHAAAVRDYIDHLATGGYA